MSDGIRNNKTLNRFERDLGGGTAIANYRMEAGVVRVFHTEVPAAMRGSGAGSAFVRDILEEARRLGLKVEPECSFMRAFMAKNPEFNDLLPSPRSIP